MKKGLIIMEVIMLQAQRLYRLRVGKLPRFRLFYWGCSGF